MTPKLRRQSAPKQIGTEPVNLRMATDLHSYLTAIAAHEVRSLSNMIIYACELMRRTNAPAPKAWIKKYRDDVAESADRELIQFRFPADLSEYFRERAITERVPVNGLVTFACERYRKANPLGG